MHLLFCSSRIQSQALDVGIFQELICAQKYIAFIPNHLYTIITIACSQIVKHAKSIIYVVRVVLCFTRLSYCEGTQVLANVQPKLSSPQFQLCAFEMQHGLQTSSVVILKLCCSDRIQQTFLLNIITVFQVLGSQRNFWHQQSLNSNLTNVIFLSQEVLGILHFNCSPFKYCPTTYFQLPECMNFSPESCILAQMIRCGIFEAAGYKAWVFACVYQMPSKAEVCMWVMITLCKKIRK